jgi:hypothetical protein
MGHDYDWEEREEHGRVMSRVLGARLQRALMRRKQELESTESLLTGQLKLVDAPPKTKRISVGAAPPPLTLTAGSGIG